MSDSLDIAQDGHLFPREDVARDVARALASEDWRERPVPRVAWGLAAIGLALVALGLPIERVLVREPSEFAAAGAGTDWRFPVHALARAAGSTGIGVEAAFFAISAACFGASFVVLGSVLRRLGACGLPAFVCALVAACSPLVLHHARLPSTVTSAVLGSSLVMWTLVGRGGGSVARVSTFGIGVWLLGASTIGPGAAEGPFGGPAGLMALGSLWLALPLALFVRSAEESLPPIWLLAWCAASIACAAVYGVPGSAVVPAFTVLLAGSLVRFERAAVAARVAAVAVGAQVVLAALAFTPRPSIPEWLVDRVNSLEPGDAAVIMNDLSVDDQRYLVERRAGAQLLDRDDDEARERAALAGRLVPLARRPVERLHGSSPGESR